MPNIIWYLMLTVFSIIILVYTLIKQDTKKGLAIYFVISGMAYALDFLVLIIFHGYEYHPYVYKEMWWDITLGSMISQGFAVPAIGTFLIMFNFRFGWYVVAGLFFMGIEEIFIHLGIYKHLWWHTIYTGSLILMGYLFARLWKGYLKEPTKLAQYLNMYFLALLVCNTIRFILSSIFHTHGFHLGWFEDVIRDQIAVNALYIFLFNILVTFVVVNFYRWYSVLAVVTLDSLFYILFLKVGILTLSSNWFVLLFAFLLTMLIGLYRWVYLRIFVARLN